jgi:dihydroorotate dehydrogenase (NAD+) catalytic subunit
VGVGTALFYDPLVCQKINAGIADYLRRHGFRNVGELVGTLATGNSSAVQQTVSAAGTAG